MSRIRSKNTAIEQIMAAALKKAGIKFKRYATIMGKPDFIVLKHKIAGFCDSSFWHGYRNMTTSRHRFKSNKKFWLKKIRHNMDRDKEVNQLLRKEGWKVLRFWDFQINGKIDKCMAKIKMAIRRKK